MEKDDKIEINVELLMEHAEKLMHDPQLGIISNLSQVVEEIQVGDAVYELRLELRLKARENFTDEEIV